MRWRAVLLGLAAALTVTPQAQAVDYPTRPIKLVVPYAAGGPTDVLGRLIGEYLGRDLKQTVVVENKAGAQGAIGAEAVARSEPDGYTLFVTAASIIVLNPLLYKKLSYDPVTDFRVLAIDHRSAGRDGDPSLRSRRRRSRSSSPTPSKIPASSISVRPAPAAPFISPARCSSRWPASR